METPKSVEAYLAGVPKESRAALEELRETIRSVAPGATEGISYHMPAFKDQGKAFVCYAAFKDHYSLFPMSVAVIDAQGKSVERYRTGKGTIRFEFDEPLPVALVKKIVKARLAENAERRKR